MVISSKYKLFLRLALAMLVALFVNACDGDEQPGSIDGATYLPLSKGVYQIYFVTETKYTNGPNGDVDQYELRTLVVDSFLIAPNTFQYVIHRSRRALPGDAWMHVDTWSAVMNVREAVIQEGNTSFVKIAMPVLANRMWNGNAYNSLGEELYIITKIKEPTTIGSNSFDDTLEITQREDVDNIVGNDIRKEVYAKNVGLVYKKIETITYCSNTTSCLGKQIIEQGVVAEYSIKEYGKE
jgi:hypothetical protein